MNIKDGRGQHKTKEAEKTTDKIKKWFDKNKGKTLKECSIKTGIPYSTLLRHIKKIKANEVEVE